MSLENFVRVELKDVPHLAAFTVRWSPQNGYQTFHGVVLRFPVSSFHCDPTLACPDLHLQESCQKGMTL